VAPDQPVGRIGLRRVVDGTRRREEVRLGSLVMFDEREDLVSQTGLVGTERREHPFPRLRRMS